MGAVCRGALKLTAKVLLALRSLSSARSPQFIQVVPANARP